MSPVAAPNLRRDVNNALQRLLHVAWRLDEGSVLLFVLIDMGTVVMLLPSCFIELVHLAAGFVFCHPKSGLGSRLGMAVAVGSVFLGHNLAGLLQLSCIRRVFKGNIDDWLEHLPKFRALVETVQEGGAIFLVLLRLTPVVPFPMSNIFFSLVPIPVRQWLLGSLGLLPRKSFTSQGMQE